ncbi:TetR/AcrR family transcriptional regulator [Georgenia halophila]|uniref:TetR/AcrR family transcriptional regulator n=1 Tax=Georgenia halophila TaxID=620889 RepID=A0ABP8KUD3_9MICO
MSTDIDHDDVEASAETPISARRERTRERLLDAALDVFSRQGLQASSIEAVCEAAGFTRGAFYSNFDSKEELFLALTERDVRTRLATLEAAVADLGDDAVQGDAVSPDAIGSVVAAVMPDTGDQRRWHLLSVEFELLALREEDVAVRFVAQQQRFNEELAVVLRRVLAGLGLRFVVPEREAIELVTCTYEATSRRAFLTHQDDDSAAKNIQHSAMLNLLVGLLVSES